MNKNILKMFIGYCSLDPSSICNHPLGNTPWWESFLVFLVVILISIIFISWKEKKKK